MYTMYISNVPEQGIYEKRRMAELGDEHGKVIIEGPDNDLHPNSCLKTPDEAVVRAWLDEGKVIRGPDGESIRNVEDL